MDELIELSSDTDSYCEDKENLTDELQAILKKYENIGASTDLFDEPSLPKKTKINHDLSASSSESESEVINIPKQVTKNVAKNMKIAEKEEKLKQKAEEKANKEAERRKKKEETEKLKAEKRALAEAFKQTKPEEAIKLVRCLLNNRISEDIIRGLEEAEITCKRIDCDRNKLLNVTWARQPQQQLIGIDGQLGMKLDEEIMPTLYIINHNELLNLSKTDQILQLAINSKGSVTLIEIDPNKPQREEEKIIETALTELQIVAGWSHRKIKSNTQLIEVIRQYTKSVALAPSKLLKASTKGEIIQPPNSDCVRIQNTTGHGLATLWCKQLAQFPLASLETAHAVVKMYPTPKSLANAGEDKHIVDELANAQVRRANGPLSAPRRLGPQLAKRVHMTFTSRDHKAIL